MSLSNTSAETLNRGLAAAERAAALHGQHMPPSSTGAAPYPSNKVGWCFHLLVLIVPEGPPKCCQLIAKVIGSLHIVTVTGRSHRET
jgi:hypothetical protein